MNRQARAKERSEISRFPSWVVMSDSKVSKFNVKVPALRLQEKTNKLRDSGVMVDGKPPKFLRLDMRRTGLRGKMKPCPVLRVDLLDGGYDNWLTVSDSLKRSIPGSDHEVNMTSASEKVFRWYRLRRSVGPLFTAVASIIGGLLVGLGTTGFDKATSRLLLIFGSALVVLAAAGLVVSVWQTPVE
jgi:hypothetical protein